MDFELTEEQSMFRDMAREFAQREVVPTARERDKEQKFFPEIIKKMGDQGLFAIMVPPEYGGLGLDWTTMGLVAEELGAVDFSVGLQFLPIHPLRSCRFFPRGRKIRRRSICRVLLRGIFRGALPRSSRMRGATRRP